MGRPARERRRARRLAEREAAAKQAPINIQESHDVQTIPLTGKPKFAARVTTEADITKDYVSSSFWGLLPVLQALPHAFDDVSCEFGPDVYERMSKDAEVAAALDVMVLSSCAGQEEVVPSLSEEDPEYKKAQYVADFHDWMISRMPISMQQVRRTMTRGALTFGSAVGEMTFGYEDYEDGPTMLVVEKIHSTCLEETAFVVDSFDNVVGIIPTKIPRLTLPIGGYVPLVANSDGSINEKTLSQIVPRSKFMIFTWDPKSNDPRGRSALRPAYTAWWAKQQILNEMLSWFGKYAQPSIWGETAPNAIAQCFTDANGNEVRKEPTEIMMESLMNFKNSSVMAVPSGSTVNMLEQSAGGSDPFLNALMWADTQITRAILKQHLATAEGIHMARASAEVHQNVLSLLILYIKQWQAYTIKRDILRPLTIANFGERNAYLTPDIDLGDGDGFPLSVSDIASLSSTQWFDTDQMAKIDKILGLPVRSGDGEPMSTRQQFQGMLF